MLIDVSQLDSQYGDDLREYCRLASQRKLSETDAEKLEEILVRAATDYKLSFLLNEADHFLAHELGLLNIAQRDYYENEQAKLEEQIVLLRSGAPKPKASRAQRIILCSELLAQRKWQIIFS
jgi:hypothetical protein